MNEGKSRRHFGLLRNFAPVQYHNEDILFQHYFYFTNEFDKFPFPDFF